MSDGSPPVRVDRAIAVEAHPLRGADDDYDGLLQSLGGVRFVLLGEATHGTHEFYRERARITRRLIERCGFDAVAIEGDWPDAYRANRYVRGDAGHEDAQAALGGFRRFPNWMWRNADVVEFLEWLRRRNRERAPGEAIGFYGLDLYSLFASIEAVLRYLDRVDPAAAARARARYRCFDHFNRDSDTYAYATAFGAAESCEDDVVAQLGDLLRGATSKHGASGSISDERFQAVQNARLVRNAEAYYRTMFRGRVSSWNLRDRHMMETLAALDAHRSQRRPAKIVVWAHNSHVGDARATAMGRLGEWTLGQLAREQYGADAVALIGFTTHRGTVIAASDWGGAAERKRVRPALADSCEDALHQAGLEAFWLSLQAGAAREALTAERLERAIGVIYLPETERASHYFEASLARQFDVVVHIDETTALAPLDRLADTASGEAPETYPSGV